jgi:hypothetical protein
MTLCFAFTAFLEATNITVVEQRSSFLSSCFVTPRDSETAMVIATIEQRVYANALLTWACSIHPFRTSLLSLSWVTKLSDMTFYLE